MPLILLLPLLAAGVFALWVVLLPLSIAQRYRHGRARRRVQPFVVGVNAWLLLLSLPLFLGGAWLLGTWIEGALRDAWAGVALGMGVGLVGLRLDRLERTPRGRFRTPNRWLVLGLSLLLALRIGLGAWLAWADPPSAGAWGWLDRGGLVGVAGVLLGYALATAWGLRSRLSRA